MTLRPTQRNRVLVTDANGRLVTQPNQSSADMTLDEITARVVYANTVGTHSGTVVGSVMGNVVGDVTGALDASNDSIKEPTIFVGTADVILTATQSGGSWVGT